MYGREVEHQWNHVEIEPSSFGGYTRTTKSVTEYHDSRAPEVSTFNMDFEKRNLEGFRQSYRVTKFPFPLLRANGVSPIVLVDVLTYDFKSKRLESQASGLVNKISSDSLLTGITCLRYQGSVRDIGVGAYSAPEHWDYLAPWERTTPRHSFGSMSGAWVPTSSPKGTLGDAVNVRISEMKSPWSLARNLELQDAFLLRMEISNSSGRDTKFNGLVCGKPEARLKMAMDFIESVGMAVSLD